MVSTIDSCIEEKFLDLRQDIDHLTCFLSSFCWEQEDIEISSNNMSSLEGCVNNLDTLGDIIEIVEWDDAHKPNIGLYDIGVTKTQMFEAMYLVLGFEFGKTLNVVDYIFKEEGIEFKSVFRDEPKTEFLKKVCN